MPSIAVYIGPFDPPVRHHRRVAEELSKQFDSVVVIPSGPRGGKSRAASCGSVHRATMCDLNFRGLPKVKVDLKDLEQNQFTPHHLVQSTLAKTANEVSFVVSSDFVRKEADGKSLIQREWQNGEKMWAESHFTILHERTEPLEKSHLPKRHTLMLVDTYLRSEAVRMLLMNDEPATDQLDESVNAYIQRRGLYHDGPQQRRAMFRMASEKLGFFVDERNQDAKNIAALLKKHHDENHCQAVVTLGGDGTMLRAIRSQWRKRVPFFGINAGGQGFLLNGRQADDFWAKELLLYHLPLLHIQTEFRDGSVRESLAFNDAWVERATGQTAWLKVSINGVERIPKIVCDGLLVATAAGSSSYARAMGATPVPLNTDVLVLAGSNVYLPTFWKPALLPTDSVIEMETLDPDRRPLRSAIDGYEETGPVRKMTIRVSRTAAAEVAFLPEHDPVAKLAFMQFPEK